MKKLKIDITIAKIKIGFAILFKPIPQARITVISDFKLSPLSVITVARRTPIGIVITITCGRFRIIIIRATLNGMPKSEICLIRVMNVSDAKMIDVNTQTPIRNISIICLKIYLSSNFTRLFSSSAIIQFYPKLIKIPTKLLKFLFLCFFQKLRLPHRPCSGLK